MNCRLSRQLSSYLTVRTIVYSMDRISHGRPQPPFTVWPLLFTIFSILCTVLVYFFAVDSAWEATPGDLHLVIVTPPLKDATIANAIKELESSYHLDAELHSFPTVGEQKRLLRLLPLTNIDGVLFWPVSGNDADYATELKALRDREIPVVIVERDIAADVRSSFVGSGNFSDAVVLKQTLLYMEGVEEFLVGNCFGSGTNQVVEMLLFQKECAAPVAAAKIQDMKLRNFTNTLAGEYLPARHFLMEGVDAQPLALKDSLISLLLEHPSLRLVFSLDSSLSSTSISAKQSLQPPASTTDLYLLCYGSLDEYQDELASGLVNGLLIPRSAAAVTIGIRYLRDICKGRWVRESADMGIDFLPSERVNAGFSGSS